MQIRFQGKSARARSARSGGLLAAEREWELARRWHESNDCAALTELVTAYRRLVVSVAANFRNFGIPLDDLIQEGNAALVHAAGRFDPDRGFRFSTYAMWWVRAAILDYVLANRSVVRRITSGQQRSLFFQVQRLRHAWRVDGRMTDEERERAAVALDVPTSQIDTVESFLGLSDVPAIEEADLEEGFVGVTLAADQPSVEEEIAERQELGRRSAWLRMALDRLSDRERAIILGRHLSEVPGTLADFGIRFGVSPERVRQIECAAMSKLRKLAEATAGEGAVAVAA